MLYITYDNFNRPNFIGMKKKVLSHIQVFENHIGNVAYTRFENGIAYYCKNEKTIEKKNVVSTKEMFACFLEWIKKYGHTDIYLRFRFPINIWLVEFLSSLNNQDYKVILEVPTYPYEGVIQNPRVLAEDRLYRRHLKQINPIIVTYSNVRKLYGIPVINLRNGVDISAFSKRLAKHRTNEIILLGVASMSLTQGYERVIESLKNYYQQPHKYNIVVWLVGNGRETTYYKGLVEKYGLKEKVIFYDYCVGEQLNKKYAMADIGIGNLGLYKMGLSVNSPLKCSEFCATGLPFVYGYEDYNLTGEEDFVMKVANDNTLINMKDVIEFYEKTVDKQDIIDSMREFAEDYFSWESILSEIINYYKGVCGRERLLRNSQ